MLNLLLVIGSLGFAIRDETPCEEIMFSRRGIRYYSLETELAGIRYFVNLAYCGLAAWHL